MRPDDNKLQRKEVLRVMGDGLWRTLPQLSSALGNRYMITSLSARIRDFRKREYGSYRVERRLVLGSERLYEYRLLAPLAIEPEQEATKKPSTRATLNLFSAGEQTP